MSGVKLDTTILKKLQKALQNSDMTASVGILGSSKQRKGVESNATIGLKHEFGIEVPKRSFIRQPLIDNLDKYINKAGFDEKILEESVESGSLGALVAKLGIVGVTVVLDGFDTGGFGKWPAHAPGYQNNTGQILVDTQQLRNSIISEVKGD